jgi:hypothetical protein
MRVRRGRRKGEKLGKAEKRKESGRGAGDIGKPNERSLSPQIKY